MDQQIMDKLRVMMAPIFDKYCVVSMDARDDCIRNIIKGGRVFDLARGKYDMAAHLDSDSALAAFAHGTAVVQKRKKLNVGVSMSASDMALVVAHNPDYQLDFDATQRVNHSVAYVQRIIETKRLLSIVRHSTDYITDVGGNPVYHARAGHDDVHSCVLIDNTRDKARDVNRTVQAQSSGVESKLRYCVAGVQECEVASSEAISLFAVQDIDPIDLVHGLYKKGVTYMTGVFHYDPIMYENSEGYFPYFRMHFRRCVVAGVTKVQFFFDNDSSFDYTHDLENLLKYSRSWSYRVPDTDYAYRYDLVYVAEGLARFTIVRQERARLGVARNEVAYRYVDHSGSVRVNSWALSFDSLTYGQYRPVTLDVSEDLFMFLYKFGLSNDTENPGKLFTVDQLRAQARTFNETRTLNGVSFTGRLKMGPDDLETLVVAMYVLVLHDMAVENYVAMAQVDSMLADQRAVLEKKFFSTTGKIVAFSFALPLIFSSGKVASFMAYVTTWLRASVGATTMDVEWTKLCSYELLPSMQRYTGPGDAGAFQLSGHSFESCEVLESHVEPKRVYDIFSDVLTDEQRAKLSAKLDIPFLPTSVVDTPVASDAQSSHDLSPTRAVFSDAADSDLAWYETDLADYLQVKRDVLWRRSQDHEVDTVDAISAHSNAAILEHARYNFDVALSQINAARDKCKEVYSGAPLASKIAMYNDAEDAGVKFLPVVAGKVSLPHGLDYAFGINPVTSEYHSISSLAGGSYISDKKVSLLFVYKECALLNGFQIGKSLLSLALKSNPVATKFHLVDAIYGAGKTHEIVSGFSEGDVVVTQTTASKDDIIESLVGRGFSRSLLLKCVRTADSAAMHGLPIASRVWLDEGLMMFPGQIFSVARLTAASDVYVYGDSAQIPPIDRSVSFGRLTYQGMCRWNSIEFRDITYRSPADVVYVLAQYFKLDRRTRLKTASPIRRSLSFRIVSNPKELAGYGCEDGWHYITVLRTDRAEFLTDPRFKDGKKVRPSALLPGQVRLLNVGEAQGSTFKRVKVVRKFPYGDEIFSSPAHAVVAFSRHLIAAEYITSVKTDPFVKLVRQALALVDAQLDSVVVPTPVWLQQRVDHYLVDTSA